LAKKFLTAVCLYGKYLGMLLSDYLSEQGITHSQFAQQIGKSTSFVSRLARGERRPGWELGSKIESETGGKVRRDDFAPTNKTTKKDRTQ